MIFFKTFEDMITSQFEQDGEKNDKGELIKSTGEPMSESDYGFKEELIIKKVQKYHINNCENQSNG